MLDLLNLPPDWSATGYEIDALIGWLHWLMLILLVPWAVYFVYVLFRFRAGANPRATHADTKAKFNKYAEIAVVVAEVVLLVGFAIPTWAKRVSSFPSEDESQVIHVIAQQFVWNIHYAGADGVFGSRSPELVDEVTNPIGLDRNDPAGADDVTTINQLYLPVDKPTIFYLSTKDVIHSFSIPYLRVKHDAIPGMTIPLQTHPVQTGDSEIACAQLCGNSHYRMRGFVHVLPQDEFDAWLVDQG